LMILRERLFLLKVELNFLLVLMLLVTLVKKSILNMRLKLKELTVVPKIILLLKLRTNIWNLKINMRKLKNVKFF
jgi:hypothetical protein